jgi:hypothetical protein
MTRISKSHAATAHAVYGGIKKLNLSDEKKRIWAEAFDRMMNPPPVEGEIIGRSPAEIWFNDELAKPGSFHIKSFDFGSPPWSQERITPVDTTPDWKHPIPTNRAGNTPSLEARLKARAKRKKRK